MKSTDVVRQAHHALSLSKGAGVLAEMKARLLGWNDATGDMFRWSWVRWNFPEPVLPGEVSRANMPLTYAG